MRLNQQLRISIPTIPANTAIMAAVGGGLGAVAGYHGTLPATLAPAENAGLGAVAGLGLAMAVVSGPRVTAWLKEKIVAAYAQTPEFLVAAQVPAAAIAQGDRAVRDELGQCSLRQLLNAAWAAEAPQLSPEARARAAHSQDFIDIATTPHVTSRAMFSRC